MANQLSIKQGATFQLLIAVANDDGSAFDLTSATITASLSLPNNTLVTALPLVVTGIPGQLSVHAVTDTWPLGTLHGCFKIVSNSTGIVLKSDDFFVVVGSGV